MKAFAVIPARGGSKGLPGKNIRKFNGKPLVAHMIEAARSASLVDRVFVSTDSEEIADIARRYGAEVIMRPEDISGDTASSEEALLHSLKFFDTSSGQLPDILIMLQCTAPFTSSEDIDGTIQTLLQNEADSALAAVPFYHFLWREDSGKASGINHDGKKRLRRQDMAPQYLEAGSVYAMRVQAFLAEKTRFCGVTSIYATQEHHRCMEIDDAADFYQAEAMCTWFARSPESQERYRLGESSPAFPKHIGAIVSDFDGVFTDNAVFTLQNGEESVRCDRGDGEGIAQLKRRGLPIVVISAEQNPVVAARCRKLGLEYLQGVARKADCLGAWLKEHSLTWDDIIYIGNDTNDKECLQRAGTSVVPCDAHSSVKQIADIILEASGGHGALRELSDMLCEAFDAERIQLKTSSNTMSAPYFPGQKDTRPWGTWEVLAVGEGYCIKRICVKPGEMLSLQYHNYRDELWKIMSSKGITTLEDNKFEVKSGDTIEIYKKQRHRIENIGSDDLLFIEIQTGTQISEDDIIRESDIYNRDK